MDVKDVYVAFKKAQSSFLQRGFRIPKDFDAWLVKQSIPIQENLIGVSMAFSTRWQNVDPERYFECGFSLLGSKFTYKRFYDKQILLLYIEKDKNIKRQQGITREIFKKSKTFAERWMSQRNHSNDISLMKQYCMLKEGGIKAPLKHYLNNDIDKYFIVWLISSSLLQLEDEERMLVPIITGNYWSLVHEVNNVTVGEIIP